jgi:hypothetical protein
MFFYLCFVYVECIGPGINENGTGTEYHKRVNRRNEGEGWDDYLISRPDVQQERCHLKCVSTGSGKQYLMDAEQLFKQGMTFLGKEAIA